MQERAEFVIMSVRVCSQCALPRICAKNLQINCYFHERNTCVR